MGILSNRGLVMKRLDLEGIIKECPKVLVMSHNCFSKNGSNGRTLGSFFLDWQSEDLAQFYISNELPDGFVCSNYFRVLDIEALKAFYSGKKYWKTITGVNVEKVLEPGPPSLGKIYNKHKEKTAINYVIRNAVWNSCRWKPVEFDSWVDDFSPDIVLLQSGDYEFMIRIALETATSRKIPVVLYNSEDYYFKDNKSLSPLYHFYRRSYKKQFERLMKYASHTIYSNEMLQATYNEKFKHESTVILTATDLKPGIKKNGDKEFVASYLGNLGIGRHKPLIEIASALHAASANAYLDVYGKTPNAEIEAELRSCPGLRLKGFVTYEEVSRIMTESDLLVHAENDSEFSRRDLKHAFSTKIADALASGVCFLVYGPANIACVKYLRENNAACVITERDALQQTVRNIVAEQGLREKYISNALRLAKQRHNPEINLRLFREIVMGVVQGFGK